MGLQECLRDIILVNDWCMKSTYCDKYHSRAGGPGLYNKQIKQAMENSITPQFLLQILAMLEFSSRLHFMLSCEL